MGSENVHENFSRGSWKVLEKSWIFLVSKRVGTLFYLLTYLLTLTSVVYAQETQEAFEEADDDIRRGAGVISVGR